MPELQVAENWHWFKFSLKIWLYLFVESWKRVQSASGNFNLIFIWVHLNKPNHEYMMNNNNRKDNTLSSPQLN